MQNHCKFLDIAENILRRCCRWTDWPFNVPDSHPVDFSRILLRKHRSSHCVEFEIFVFVFGHHKYRKKYWLILTVYFKFLCFSFRFIFGRYFQVFWEGIFMYYLLSVPFLDIKMDVTKCFCYRTKRIKWSQALIIFENIIVSAIDLYPHTKNLAYTHTKDVKTIVWVNMN